MLSQNPRGPSGHAPGSWRISRKPARPRKISGQWRAQRARPVAYRIARSPIASTNSPATLWLNSDHARSAAVRGASRSSTGISSIAGDESVGHRGVNRVPTSASVARSAATSTAGGSEVSDAATNRAVTPSPTSPSTNRRRDLVQSIERQQEAARPEPRRRVARPRRAHRERQRPPEKRDPSQPGARRTADAETTDDEPDAGEDAGGGGADVRRGDKLADGPAAATHQGAELDGKREELRPAKDRRARRGGREAPAERRRQRRARAHRGA